MEQGLDEALGFAVRLRSARPGVAVTDLQPLAAGGEVGGAVAAAVVAEDALDRDAAAGEVAAGPLEDAGCGRRLLVCEQLDVGEAAVVVDADVQILVAGAGLEATTSPPEQPVPRTIEACELLDVEMDELARSLMLVAVDRLERIQAGATTQTRPFQDQRHRRECHPQHLGDLSRRHPQPPQPQYRLDTVGRRPARLPQRSRGAVEQTSLPLSPPTRAPLRRRPLADASRHSCLTQCPSALDPLDQQPTTARAGPRVTVKLHTGPPGAWLLRSSSLQ